MNRTDRLLAIVLELQAHGRRRAEDLAAHFETSKRTIYRDIQALSESGVPVVAVPGQGYTLQEGFFLPPLTFTTDEATMLLLGAGYLARHFDAQYRRAAETASAKIGAVLPEPRRAEVRDVQESIGFIAPDAASPATQETLRRLRRAILERASVRFAYHPRHPSDSAEDEGAALTEREVDPYAITHIRGAWYLRGYCHQRRALRNFRFDRIEDLELLPATFARPEGFRPEWRDDLAQRALTIRALVSPRIARWVREAPSFFQVAEEERPDGLLITLRTRREDDALGWLLGWGSGVRVLEPASLRRRLAEEAAAILRHHDDARE